ncbi:MAG: hypothetical protein ABSF64_21670 [Bryobacteraceae bacterium]|jgi:hypothetical protein
MEIDVAAGRAFVFHKVLTAYEPSRLCAEVRLRALRPGFPECDTVNRHQNINSNRGLANLVKEAFVRKVIRAEAGERRAKLNECPPNFRGVLRIGLDPNVEILGVTGLRVKHHGVTAYDEVLNFVGVENSQQFFEV